MSLADLKAFAVKNNNQSATPWYELPIEQARERIVIRDGNKVKKADEQALTLSISKRVLPLDAIQAGATRLNVSTDQVEAVTNILQDAIDAGEFDEAIVAVQTAGKPVEEEPATDE